MNRSNLKQNRILALSPSVRGLGFAVLDPQELLVDWGVKVTEGTANHISIRRMKEMIEDFEPTAVALENTAMKSSRRSKRVRILHRQMIALARNQRLRVCLFTPAQIRQVFQVDPQTTKDGLAEVLAQRFPEQLAVWLPPKRRAWMKTQYRMCIFEAAALAVAAQKSVLK